MYQWSRMRHLFVSPVVMATVQQKVECVLWPAELKSVTRVQRKVRLVPGGSAPGDSSIKKYDRRLTETGNVTSEIARTSEDIQRKRGALSTGVSRALAQVDSHCKQATIPSPLCRSWYCTVTSGWHSSPLPSFLAYPFPFHRVPHSYFSLPSSNPTSPRERPTLLAKGLGFYLRTCPHLSALNWFLMYSFG
jgi:hypothetical protein